jgi:hypothetical protein
MNKEQQRERKWAWEAVATHKELIAEYGRKSPLTRRRWRTEGSRAGNSRLLTLTKARDARAKYGGRVVEVIPFTSLAIRQAAGLKVCPHCKASAGEPCKSSSGATVTPHLKRWEDQT